MPDDIDRLYREGLAAIRAGDKTTGKEKLMQVVEADQLHEQAWLWLSACVDTKEDQIVCLQNVLTVNPQSEAARGGLKKLGVSLPEDEATPEAPLPSGKPHVQPAPPLPVSAFPPDEQWRAKIVEQSASDEGFFSDAILIPSRPDLPPRSLLDLASAWANALIFKISGPYNQEVEYGSVPHILFNIVAAVLLQLLAALVFGVLLLATGSNPGSLLTSAIDSLNEMLTAMGQLDASGLIYPPLRPAFNYLVDLTGSGGGSIPQISPAVAASFGVIFAVYLVVTVLTTFVGQMIQAIAVNTVAEWLGGKGGIVQVTLALTIGLVATNILQIPVWASLPFSRTIFTTGILALGVYQFLQMANAVRAAHKLNILVSMGVIIIAGVVMSIVGGVFGCLISLVARL
jgi:hypothetical protein